MVIVLTACLAIYVFVLVEESQNHQIVPITALTWSSYVTDCGHTAWIKQRQLAVRTFDTKYYNKGIDWSGWVVKVNLNEDEPISMVYHAASLYLKMEEDDQEGVMGADIGISLSEKVLVELKDVVENLHRGDKIRFKASL
jgi:hypothetical protein